MLNHSSYSDLCQLFHASGTVVKDQGFEHIDSKTMKVSFVKTIMNKLVEYIFKI